MDWPKAEDEEGRTLLHMVASFTEESRLLWTQLLVLEQMSDQNKKRWSEIQLLTLLFLSPILILYNALSI